MDSPVTGLDDWGLYNDPSIILEAYQIWQMTNYQVCPYPGSIYDQPWHIKADFLTLSKVERWHRQQKERPTADGLPRMDEY